MRKRTPLVRWSGPRARGCGQGVRARLIAVGVWAIAGCPLLVTAQPSLEATSAPRLQASGLPSFPPLAIAGGEVILELTIDAAGGVSEVHAIRATPPYTEALTSAVSGWRFAPAVRVVDERLAAAPGRVIVSAVIRPPTLYSGATAGTPPHPAGVPSAQVPVPLGLTPPVYPPNARGSGLVLIEIEMNGLAQPTEFRVLATTGGFEDAALDAVRTWRFTPPADDARPARLFAYAVIGFREPIAPR